MLLVLDNFEHVLGAAAAISSLLDACPMLCILVTSRIPLHLRREHEYAVVPLAVPSDRPPRHPDALRRYDAIALLEERARAVRTDFTLDEANGESVAEICRRLDGLPLAIELAAAQLKFFSPASLSARLDHRLTALVGGARDLPARQQTLRNTIDWSYSLLNEDEQSLFAELSVFAGGCTLEAVEAVCQSDSEVVTIERLTSLVDQSLVHRADGHEQRFAMLETIREFAAQRLGAGGRGETLQRLHASYFREFSERAGTKLRGPDQIVWAARLQEEIDNLRAALTWSLEHDPDTALRIMTATHLFWSVGDQMTEARAWFRRTLSSRHRASPTIVAKALLISDELLDWFNDAPMLLHEALGVFRSLGDPQGEAEALCALAARAAYVDRHDEAMMLAQAAHALLRAADPEGADDRMASTYANLAKWRGDLPYAQQIYEQQAEHAHRVGDSWRHLRLLHQLAEVATMQWDGAGACRWGQETLVLGEALRRPAAIRGAYLTISYGRFILGQPGEATEYARQSLRCDWELGGADPLILEQLALCAGALGQPRRAARLWGTVEARRTASGVQAPAIARSIYEPFRAAARQELGDRAWSAAQAEGHAMSTAEAVRYALGALDPL
jgi:predicted ATPase